MMTNFNEYAVDINEFSGKLHFLPSHLVMHGVMLYFFSPFSYIYLIYDTVISFFTLLFQIFFSDYLKLLVSFESFVAMNMLILLYLIMKCIDRKILRYIISVRGIFLNMHHMIFFLFA